MVCTLIFRMHLIRGHRTIIGMFIYCNAAYHHVGNALDFKPRYCRSHMLLFMLRFLLFYFQPTFIVYELILVVFCTWVSQYYFWKKCEIFCNSFKFKIWYCRVAVIYAAFCHLSDDIPFSVGVHFGRQWRDEQMDFFFLLKHSRTWHKINTSGEIQLFAVLSIRCMCRFLHIWYMVYFMLFV